MSRLSVSVFDTIDMNDLESAARIRSPGFRKPPSSTRHDHILRFLLERSEAEYGWKRNGANLHELYSRGQFGKLLTVARNFTSYRESGSPPKGAPVIWPLARMVGWKLWWAGGSNAMRTNLEDCMCTRTAVSPDTIVSCDMIRHSIGLEPDIMAVVTYSFGWETILQWRAGRQAATGP